MAVAQGISKSSVSRIWRSHNLKPHRTETFKLSRDPRFLEKLTDVVGLYLNPPDQAIVLCVDEKSQIQALQRTQPGLPLKKGPLRANIDETVLLVVITEQGENRHLLEDQWNLPGFPYGFARRGT